MRIDDTRLRPVDDRRLCLLPRPGQPQALQGGRTRRLLLQLSRVPGARASHPRELSPSARALSNAAAADPRGPGSSRQPWRTR